MLYKRWIEQPPRWLCNTLIVYLGGGAAGGIIFLVWVSIFALMHYLNLV
jgi:hypothetical protein